MDFEFDETPVDDECRAWQDDDLDTTNMEPKPYDQLLVNFDIEIVTAPEAEDDDEDEEPDYERLATVTRQAQFPVRCDWLNRNNLSPQALSAMLDQLRVPMRKHPFVIQRVCPVADEIANAPCNRNKRVLPITVEASLVVDGYPLNDDDDDDTDRSMAKAVPANRESIKALKKIRVDDKEKHCAVCMAGMEVGCEATRMPCGHVFHGDCVERWLVVSGCCPLCRFELKD